jgi:hypothetical protein
MWHWCMFLMMCSYIAWTRTQLTCLWPIEPITLQFSCMSVTELSLRKEDICTLSSFFIIIIIIIIIHGLGRLTCSGIDALPTFQTKTDELVLQVWGFCEWADNPPKENKILISKDAQPYISADQILVVIVKNVFCICRWEWLYYTHLYATFDTLTNVVNGKGPCRRSQLQLQN